MKFFLLILFSTAISLLGFSANKTFTGPGNFSNAALWGGALPVAGDDLRINGVCTFDNAAANLAYRSMDVGNAVAGTLNWPVGGTNTLNAATISSSRAGSAINMTNGGTLQIRTSWATTNQTFTPGTGTVHWNVTTGNTTLPAGRPAYNNLTVTVGTFTATIGTATTVSNNLLVNTGTFRINGNNFTCNGTATINSTVVSSNTAGTETLNNVVMNLGSVWNNTAAETHSISSLTMSAASVTGVATGVFNVSGNYTVSTGTSVTATSTWNVTGVTTINGTLNITSTTGTKTLGDVIVNGTLNNSANENVTITGNLTNNGTFSSGTGTYSLTGAAKTISGSAPFTIQTLALTGTYTNNANLSVTTTLGSAAGTITQGATGTLNIGVANANFTLGTFNTSAVGNTVNYSLAGSQNIRTPNDGSYYHLTVSGSGTKSMTAALNVNGNLFINGATLDAVSSTRNINLGGNWANTAGTYTHRNNLVTLNGAGTQTITKSTGETFFNLTCAGTGTKLLGGNITVANDLTISSALDASTSDFGITVNKNWVNNGTFTAQNGTVTLNGTGVNQSIGGTTITSFANVTLNNATGATLNTDANLTNTLTLTNGTFTVPALRNFTLVSTAARTARIAAIPATANFAGNIIMQRYTGTGPTDWRFLSSAVSGATIAQWSDDFATSGFAGSTCPGCGFVSIYSYDETQAGDLNAFGYVPATDVTNSISNGKGFWVYLGPTPVTFEVVGAPNKFSAPLSVTYNNSGNINNDGWNLVANPYPSAIDWNDVNWTKENLDNAVYIYNSSNGSYASYVAGAGSGVNGGSRYLPSQQAFWVKANGGGVPVLTAIEPVKTSGDNTFLKVGQISNLSHYPMAFNDFPIPLNANNTPNSIKLTANGNGYDDEMLIQFTAGATNNFDGQYDAWKLKALNPSIANLSSVMNDTLDFSINSLPDLTSDVTIKIRITVPSTGTYSLRRDSILMLPMSSCIILEDLANGNRIDLRSTISYTFTISDTTKAPRFLLHVSAPVTTQTFSAKCFAGSTGMAIAKGSGAAPWTYVWKDSIGTILKTETSFTSDTLSNLSAGNYSVEISATSSICGTVSEPVTITQPSSITPNASITNVSCFGMNDGTVVTNSAGGTPPYTYLWNNGATTSQITNLTPQIYSVTITDANGCTQTANAPVTEPPTIVASFTANTDTVDLSGNPTATFTNTSSGAVTYSWDFGDGSPIDSSINPVHPYTFSGTYPTTMIAINGICTDTFYNSMVVIDSVLTTSITQYSNLNTQISISTDNQNIVVQFNFDEVMQATISLYNLIGENIMKNITIKTKNEKIKVPLPSSTSKTIYLLKVQTEKGNITRKIAN